MKKYLFVYISVIGCTVGMLLWIHTQTVDRAQQTAIQSPIPTEINIPSVSTYPISPKHIQDDGHNIAYQYVIAAPSQVTLFSNLKQSTDSASAKRTHQCTSLINAGFYTKEQKHLGLFISNHTNIHPAIESTLVDGYLSISDTNQATISFQEPSSESRFAVQSGPIIRTDSTKRLLRLIDDKFARRSIAGISDDGHLIFLTLYFKDQEYSGPLLSRTPYILEAIQQAENMHITAAINLDGGSASAFLSDTGALTELAPIGGFFCIKTKNTVE